MVEVTRQSGIAISFAVVSDDVLYTYPATRDGNFGILKLYCKEAEGIADTFSLVVPQSSQGYAFAAVTLCPLDNNKSAWFCLLSKWPCLSLLESAVTALKSIYLESGSNQGYSHLAPYIHSLTCQAMPSFNKTVQVIWTNGAHESEVKTKLATRIRPRTRYLPFVDNRSLHLVFSTFDVSTVLKIVYEHLILEHCIVVRSRQVERLTPFMEGVLSLMFPLSWQGIYVPFLSRQALLDSILKSRCPFFVGVLDTADLETRALVEKSVDKSSTCICIDLDNGCFELWQQASPPCVLPKTQQGRLVEQLGALFRKYTPKQFLKCDSDEEVDSRIKSMSTSSSCASLTSLMSAESSTSTMVSSESGISTRVMANQSRGASLKRCDRWIDKARSLFVEVFLHMFSNVDLYMKEATCINESSFLSSFPIEERGYVSRVISTRLFSDFLYNKAHKRTEAFDAMGRPWNDVESVAQRKPVFRVLQTLLLEMGYNKESSKAASAKLMQLSYDQLNHAISSTTALKQHLEEIELPENEKSMFYLLQQSNLRNLLKRPAKNRCPPIVVRVSEQDTIDTIPISASSVEDDVDYRGSSNGAMLCALSLTGIVEEAQLQPVPVESKESIQYVLTREREMYRDTINALTAVESKQKSELQTENDELREELRKLKSLLNGTQATQEPRPPSKPVSENKKRLQRSVTTYPPPPRAAVKLISPASFPANFAARRSPLFQNPGTNKFEPQVVKRRSSMLFKK